MNEKEEYTANWVKSFLIQIRIRFIKHFSDSNPNTSANRTFKTVNEILLSRFDILNKDERCFLSITYIRGLAYSVNFSGKLDGDLIVVKS